MSTKIILVFSCRTPENKGTYKLGKLIVKYQLLYYLFVYVEIGFLFVIWKKSSETKQDLIGGWKLN